MKMKQVFDKIVFATHASIKLLDLLDEPTLDEIEIFSNFQYTKNKAYLHTVIKV